MGVLGRTTIVAGAVRNSRGRHPLGRRLGAVLPMLRDAFTGRWTGAPRGRLLAGIAGLFYVVSPLDFLPEALLGPFGLGDDLAIAALSVAALLSSAEEWLDRDVLPRRGPSSDGGEVIQGVVLDSQP